MLHNLKVAINNLILKYKMRQLPLVVILGATGTGKTKLSLELSQQFNGEIIGADAMQVYNELNILTAKATLEERSLVPHHLINIINPYDQFTVVDYRNRVLPIIDHLFAQDKIPIIVGGTNYYIESILWKILVDNDHYLESNQVNYLDKLPSEELHKQLEQVDPERAKQLHPNNKRKILRSLEIYHLKGEKHSQILRNQQKSKGGSALGGGLRYRNAIIFWLQSEQTVLDDRLNARVDTMVKDGLIDEVEQFYENHMKDKVDYTKGIFQSIGLREFHKYLYEKEDENLQLQNAIEGLKMVTRRYARKQRRWITNRLLSESDREVPPVYGLDVTDVTQWDTNIKTIAFEIIESVLKGTPCTHQPLPRVKTSASPASYAQTFSCDSCKRIFVGEFQWKTHLASSKHRKVAKKRRDVTKLSESDNHC